MSTDTGTTLDDVGDQAPDDGQDQPGGPAREAQAQRARRREVEAARDAALAERDAAVARVERLQRAEAERLAADVLTDGADLWLVGGVELASVLTDDGDLDPAAVTTAAQAVIDQRGTRFARARSGSWDGGARTPPPSPRPGLGELLQQRARGQRDRGAL